MGKKGKKAKITGTPDVIKFKQTREFQLLQECVIIQESLPFVAVDPLDDLAYKRVARFLNMVGLLAEHLQVTSKKDYRFNYHHKYLSPTPQFFPFGFDVDVIRQARLIDESSIVIYNEQKYFFPEELRTMAVEFLKHVDTYMTKIASEIEPRIKDDFQMGLRRFKYELKEDLEAFDELWMKFECEFVKERHNIISSVFDPIDRLVQTEVALSEAEERLDIEAKQRLENDFVRHVQDFTNELLPATRTERFPEDAICLAEACIFFESKCREDWLQYAKVLIKDYLELRIYISKIPDERLKPQLKENTSMTRLLKDFHASVLAAREGLDFVSKQPKLIHAKTHDWMTMTKLLPDLTYIQGIQRLTREHASGH